MTETAPVIESDEAGRNNAKLAHIVNGFFPIVGALIFWITGKDNSKFVDDQGKEALNFGLLIAAGLIISSFLMFILIGFITWFGVWIFSIVMGFKGGGAAAKGETFRYPWNPLRLIK